MYMTMISQNITFITVTDVIPMIMGSERSPSPSLLIDATLTSTSIDDIEQEVSRVYVQVLFIQAGTFVTMIPE